MARTANLLVKPVPLPDKQITINEALQGLVDFNPLDTSVQVYEGGKAANKSCTSLTLTNF